MASDISVIIPVFNRPSELEELLQSLTRQTDTGFDVIVVDDGSMETSESVVEHFKDSLSIHYFYKENSGPGVARNYGCERSRSDFFIFFDSDCIIPDSYIASIKKEIDQIDAFGGPDKAHDSFTSIQKAISYAMTSFFTTGGIRGGGVSAERFHPRSFNMGFSRQVYDKTGGFSSIRFGEDIDLSIRIFGHGLTVKLIPQCFVYHKRRTNFRKFFRQVFNSGIARINLFKRHPGSLRVVHFFPLAFVLYQLLSIPHALYHGELWALWPTVIYLFLILLHATKAAKSPKVGLLAIPAILVQLFGYGLGFAMGVIKRIVLNKPEFHAFNKTFYD